MRTNPISSSRAKMSPLALWIRTGHWVPAQVVDLTLEVKSNPNHDPKDGRFTSGPGGGGSGKQRQSNERAHSDRGDGSWNGGGFSGGGGGSFEGGGASGDGYWMNPAEVRAFSKRYPDLNPHMARPGETLEQIAASHHTTSDQLRQLNGLSSSAVVKPGQVLALPKAAMSGVDKLQHVSSNGYSFGIDTSGRTSEAEGGLHFATRQERSRENQRQAGGADRRATDDGGHFIAARFGGPSDSFNHFAQDANFNRGAYRKIEDEWAKDLRAGKHVSADILAHYSGTSRRPDLLVVNWSVDGKPRRRPFTNAPGGK